MSFAQARCILYNGDFHLAESPVLSLNNRSFRYGDAVFESIHASGTEPQFIHLHMNRLIRNMQFLKMEVPAFFSSDNISALIRKLLNKNRIFGGARIRMTVFRNPGGLYAPEQHSVSFTLESAPLEINHYSLNPQGLVAGVYPDMSKHIHPLSSLKSSSALLYVMAGIYKTEKNLDDCILLNEKGHLVESGSSNIFLVKNRQIFTPGLIEGCLPGIMRQVIASCIKTANYPYTESIPLKVSDLMAADEVFLTNAITGIRWVGAIQQKRYYHEISGELLAELNRLAFGK